MGFYYAINNVAHGYLATPGQGAVALGAAGNPRSGSGLDSASGTGNVLVTAAALGNTTPEGTPAVSAASTSGANGGDGLGGMSASQPKAGVTVPNRLRSSLDSADGRVYVVSAAAAATGRHSAATVDAVFASADALFAPMTPI